MQSLGALLSLCPITAPSVFQALGAVCGYSFLASEKEGGRAYGGGGGGPILASRVPQNPSPQLLSQIFVELLPHPNLSRPCPVALPSRWLRFLRSGEGGLIPCSHPITTHFLGTPDARENPSHSQGVFSTPDLLAQGRLAGGGVRLEPNSASPQSPFPALSVSPAQAWPRAGPARAGPDRKSVV